MKFYALIKRIVQQACLFFTLLITAVYSFGAFVNSEWVPTPTMVYSLLGFALILSCLNAFLLSDCLVFALRLLIHYFISAASFYLFFVALNGYKASGGSTVTVILLYTLVYAIFAIIFALDRHFTTQPAKKNKQYTKMF